MLFSTFASAIFLVGAAAIPHGKGDTATNATAICPYGTGMNRLPALANPSGIAHVSAAAVHPANLSSVTFDTAQKGTGEWCLSTTPVNSTTSETGTFYIVQAIDAFQPVVFLTANTTAPTGAVTAGFLRYGSVVMCNDKSTYEAQFWAVATNNATDEFEILWNESDALMDRATPVILRL